MKSPPKSRGAATFSQEATKRTEDNHSLLADEAVQQGMQNQLFGQFKGFTLSPISKSKPPEIVRPAPPIPTAPIILSPTAAPKSPQTHSLREVRTSPHLKRSLTTQNEPGSSPVKSPLVHRSNSTNPNALSSGLSIINSATIAPALPPLNPGSHARPIISSPILENSTCTAKELISPLRNAPKVPVRFAPEAPKPVNEPQTVPQEAIAEEPKKPKETMSTINRIASFLKSGDKKPHVNTNSLPRNAHKLLGKNLDKNALRSVEISKPIPQSAIEVANALPVDSAETKNVVMRAQSMRGTNVMNKPNIQSFGSMRQPNGLKRPVSIPSGTRPKSPPPPRPPAPPPVTVTTPPTALVVEKNFKPDAKVTFKVPNLPGYQPPGATSGAKNKQNQYDDCLNESTLSSSKNTPSSDNIYAVIEETPISSPDSKNVTTTSSGSSESVGLLGEIVSEIQNRNLESIYSTNTMGRKKKPEVADNEIYVNTSGLYKTPDESVYSNTSNIKSSASSTSSGYITPAAVNPPVKPVVEEPDTKTSSFKSDYKPYHTTLSRAQGPLASAYKQSINQPPKTDVSSSSNNNSNKVLTTPPSPKAVLNRQTTPPNLRTRKPSPTRTTSTTTSTPKAAANAKTKPSNSPDLVTSCANSKSPTSKPPDVLNVRNKPASVPAKPVLPKATGPPKKSGSVKSAPPTEKKPETNKPPIASKVIKSVSDAGGAAKSLSAGAKIAAKQSSNVAALQQKFEVKAPASGGKAAAAVKK